MPSEDPDEGCLQLPGSVWVEQLLAAEPWGTGTITQRQNLQWVLGGLSCEDTVRPRGEDAAWRHRGRDGTGSWVPLHSPNPGTPGSMAFGLFPTQRETVNHRELSVGRQGVNLHPTIRILVPRAVCVSHLSPHFVNATTLWAAAHQDSCLSMGFSGKRYWSGLPRLLPGRSNLRLWLLLRWQAGSYHQCHLGDPLGLQTFRIPRGKQNPRSHHGSIDAEDKPWKAERAGECISRTSHVSGGLTR